MIPFAYSVPATLRVAHRFLSCCEVYNRVLGVEVVPVILLLNEFPSPNGFTKAAYKYTHDAWQADASQTAIPICMYDK